MAAALPRRQLSLVDEFLTGHIVGPGLCLNFEVTDRLRLGSSDEVCLGTVCPQPVSYTHLTLPTIYSV